MKKSKRRKIILHGLVWGWILVGCIEFLPSGRLLYFGPIVHYYYSLIIGIALFSLKALAKPPDKYGDYFYHDIYGICFIVYFLNKTLISNVFLHITVLLFVIPVMFFYWPKKRYEKSMKDREARKKGEK